MHMLMYHYNISIMSDYSTNFKLSKLFDCMFCSLIFNGNNIVAKMCPLLLNRSSDISIRHYATDFLQWFNPFGCFCQPVSYSLFN